MFDKKNYKAAYLASKWLFNEAKAGDPWKPLNEWTDLELVKRNEELSSMSGWQFTKSKESELWNVQDEMSKRHLYL